MGNIVESILEHYCSAMREVLAINEQKEAEPPPQASQLDMGALVRNYSISEIASIHKQALSIILQDYTDASTISQIAIQATDFLTRVLSTVTFEQAAVGVGYVDLNGRERAEVELKQLNAELEASAEECTSKFTQVNQRLAEEISGPQSAQDRLNQQIERLHWMYNLASNLNGADTLDEIYHVALQGIQHTFKTEFAAILMFDDRGVPRYQASMGISEAYKQAVESYCASLSEMPQTELVVVPDAAHQPGVELLDTMRKAEDIKAAASFPMQYQGRQLGKIAVYYDAPHLFTNEEIQLVQTISTYTSVAITRKQAEMSLQESQRFVQNIADSMPDVLYVYDAIDQRNIYLNQACSRVLGYTPEELQVIDSDLFTTLMHPDDLASLSDDVHRLHNMKAGEVMEREYRIKRASGEWKWLYSRDTVFSKDADGRTKQIVGIAQDISDRKANEQKIRQQLAAMEASTDGIAIVNQNGIFTYSNNAHAKIFGCNSTDETLGKSWEDFYDREAIDYVESAVESSVLAEGAWKGELIGTKKDGSKFPVEISITALADRNAVWIHRDVSDRKQAEMQLQDSLKEKEMLLKEIHHRVKNNLQILASLLNLQKRSIEDPKVAQLFEDSKNRVYSMAMIHESLYQSKQLNQVNLAKYLQDLVDVLAQSNDIQSKQIQFLVDADAIDVNIETAMPCGLIVNELVTNAIKHAFPDLRQGQVLIECRGIPNGQILLAVRDNGVGIPVHIDPNEASSLGLRIAKNLARQLKGNIELDTSDGTCFSLKFAELGYRNRI